MADGATATLAGGFAAPSGVNLITGGQVQALPSLTLEACAELCSSFTYFGVSDGKLSASRLWRLCSHNVQVTFARVGTPCPMLLLRKMPVLVMYPAPVILAKPADLPLAHKSTSMSVEMV